jgi:hypothetical protein
VKGVAAATPGGQLSIDSSADVSRNSISGPSAYDSAPHAGVSSPTGSRNGAAMAQDACAGDDAVSDVAGVLTAAGLAAAAAAAAVAAAAAKPRLSPRRPQRCCRRCCLTCLQSAASLQPHDRHLHLAAPRLPWHPAAQQPLLVCCAGSSARASAHAQPARACSRPGSAPCPYGQLCAAHVATPQQRPPRDHERRSPAHNRQRGRTGTRGREWYYAEEWPAGCVLCVASREEKQEKQEKQVKQENEARELTPTPALCGVVVPPHPAGSTPASATAAARRVRAQGALHAAALWHRRW